MLIAIDGSTVATGYAFGGASDGVPRGGVWTLPGADELNFDRTLRLVSTNLIELADLVKAERVAIEAPLLLIDREHGRDAASALIQLTGALRAAAARANCIVSLMPVDKVRKGFIGHSNLDGRTAKLAVMERCRALGWPFQDDNQADANALWCHAMGRFYKNWQPRCARAA